MLKNHKKEAAQKLAKDKAKLSINHNNHDHWVWFGEEKSALSEQDNGNANANADAIASEQDDGNTSTYDIINDPELITIAGNVATPASAGWISWAFGGGGHCS